MKTEKRRCSVCSGTGQQTCMMCSGTGRWRGIQPVLPDREAVDRICLSCNGKGQRTCQWCHGKGHTEVMVPEFGFSDSHIPRHHVGVEESTRIGLGRSEVTSQFRPTAETPSAPQQRIGTSVFLLASMVVLLSAVLAIANFGYQRTLVAAEGFFICGGWLGLRFARWLGEQKSARLESFRVWMAIGLGLCGGLLASWLLLTTQEGQLITQWVSAETIRLVSSLLGSVTALGLLEWILHKLLRRFS